MLYIRQKLIKVIAILAGLWFFLALIGPVPGQSSEPSALQKKAAEKETQKKEKEPALPERYRKWLEQEVVYIITPV
ncbi:MAG: hypothetical protein ACPLRA_07465, partial [Candidatus Saccharicenans sp.]